jgi:hypothetical protein
MRQITFRRINDWIRPGIKIKEVISSDYFLIGKNYLDGLRSSRASEITSNDEEKTLGYFILLCGTKPDSGVKLVMEGPILLYEVENRNGFARKCKDWIGSLKFSDDFWDRNSISRGDFDAPGLKVLDLKNCKELLSKHASLLPKINFGQKITLLGIWRKSKKEKNEPSSKNDDDLVEFIFRAEQDVPSGYIIFIHIMDNDKKIIFQHDFLINPDRMVIPANTTWKSSVAIPRAELVGAYSLGFGACIPNKEETLLESKYNQSDWNGKRVLLPLK